MTMFVLILMVVILLVLLIINPGGAPVETPEVIHDTIYVNEQVIDMSDTIMIEEYSSF